MNYELAMKLKDAGFPQKIGGGMFIAPDNSTARFNMPPKENQNSFHSICYLPTLSELIEVCGDRFVILQNHQNAWLVFGGTEQNKVNVIGQTPEEAVANLWLELNKN